MTNLIAMLAVVVMQIESGGEPNPAKALGDYNARRGIYEAVGAYQIQPTSLHEANRVETILASREGREPRRWAYTDRTCLEKSFEMFSVTMQWHYGRGETDPVTLGAKWHRPYGTQCERYRQKVRRGIEQYKNNVLK